MPGNKKVTPPVSQQQRRFMGAVKEGKVPGVKPSVGREKLNADPGGKLPKRVSKGKPKR
jgi:hypothetical protein